MGPAVRLGPNVPVVVITGSWPVRDKEPAGERPDRTGTRDLRDLPEGMVHR